MNAETQVIEIAFPGNPGAPGWVATPEISVVLSTYARADTLRTTLRCLAEQDLPPGTFELIVVDDGSPDHTSAVVESILPGLPFPSRYRRHPNHGPGYTQNCGIDMATAPLVYLICDDIFLAPGAVRAHLEAHRARPERTVAVLGKVMQDPELKDTVFLSKWDPFRFDEIDSLTELPPYRFWAMNLSFHRDFVVENGKFLEHYGRGGPSALEDLELGVRLQPKGMRLYYAKGALGYHHHVVSMDQAIRRWYERGLNYGEFRRYAKSAELTVWFHILDRHTFREYAGVLRGPNTFSGREKSLAWHLLREAVRRATFNAVTTRWLWRPFFDLGERVPLVGRMIRPKMYRAFLYWHFLRGVGDARRIYGD